MKKLIQVLTVLILAANFVFAAGMKGPVTKSENVVKGKDAIYSYDFEIDAEGWTILNSELGWQWGDDAALSSAWFSFAGNETNFFGINSDAYGDGLNVTDTAISPALDLAAYAGEDLILTYNYFFGATGEVAEMKYRTAPESEWVLLSDEAAEGWQIITVNLPQEALVDGVQIGLYYDDGNEWAYGAGIDDVAITMAPSAPVFSVVPESSVLGYILKDNSVIQEFTVENTAGGTLTLADESSITVIGADADQFFADLSSLTFPVELAGGESCIIPVTFTPTAVGEKVAQLQINDNIAKSENFIDLSGTGFEGIFEGFEGDVFPPENWTIQTNTAADGGLDGTNLTVPGANTWFQCNPESFEGGGRNLIHRGDFSAALGYDAPDFEWLISPELILGEQSILNFWLYYINNVEENWISKFFVVVYDKVEGTWTPLLDYSTVDVPTNMYENFVEVDLNAYSDKTVKIAFVFEYNDGYELALDEVSISNVIPGSSSIDDNIATTTALHQNYPNPFNPSTTIKFSTAAAGNVKLVVYNVKGEIVANLINRDMKAGHQNVQFNAGNLNSGVYYYTLQTAGKSFTKKMILIK